MTTTEMVDGLGRLAEIMQEAKFSAWASWCRNAIDEFKQRKEIAVVMHANYADGADVSAFWSKVLAEEYVEEDTSAVLKELERQGYQPKTVRQEDRVEIYAADGNIYYEWQIEPTTIIEETSSENTEITNQHKEYRRRLDNLDQSVIGLLMQARAAVSQSASDTAKESLEQIDRCISSFCVDARCPRCGKQLYLSDLPQYAYVCYDCDENFFDLETVHKEAQNGDK